MMVSFLFARSLSTGTLTRSTRRVAQVKPYPPAWPYAPRDFARDDASSDSKFYKEPRMVMHIDEPAAAALTAHYEDAFMTYRREMRLDPLIFGSATNMLDILDVAASHTSHLPSALDLLSSEAAEIDDIIFDAVLAAEEKGEEFVNAVMPGENVDGEHGDLSTTLTITPAYARIAGIGMNRRELKANKDLTEHKVYDLNKMVLMKQKLRLPYDDETFDFVTCALSIDYFVDPLALAREMRRVVHQQSGVAILTFSNRMFPTKAFKLWRDASEATRVEIARNILHFAGFESVEAFEIIAPGGDSDPLWAVHGTRINAELAEELRLQEQEEAAQLEREAQAAAEAAAKLAAKLAAKDAVLRAEAGALRRLEQEAAEASDAALDLTDVDAATAAAFLDAAQRGNEAARRSDYHERIRIGKENDAFYREEAMAMYMREQEELLEGVCTDAAECGAENTREL